jgi:hypothetical protein
MAISSAPKSFEAELAHMRETVKRLNRRVQSAESGLTAKLVTGPCLGRALANSAATMYREKLADAEAQHAALQQNAARLVKLVWALGNWNDHNWTDADYRRWRDAARKLCEEMAPTLPEVSP